MDKRDRREYCRKWYKRNKISHLSKVKAAARKIRKIVLEYYGGKCICCGESESQFLALDHKNNDGRKERRQLKLEGGGENFYRYVVNQNFPNRYQLLCHNCNFSKYVNKGQCIHKVSRVIAREAN